MLSCPCFKCVNWRGYAQLAGKPVPSTPSPVCENSIERNGKFLGWLEPHTPAVTRRRQHPQTVWFAIRPDGVRTEFTFSSRKQAIEWLEQAK